MSARNLLSKRELLRPMRVICARCQGEARILPLPKVTVTKRGRQRLHIEGHCLCGRCTFGQEGLTLNEMLVKIFGGEEQAV